MKDENGYEEYRNLFLQQTIKTKIRKKKMKSKHSHLRTHTQTHTQHTFLVQNHDLNRIDIINSVTRVNVHLFGVQLLKKQMQNKTKPKKKDLLEEWQELKMMAISHKSSDF